MQKMRNFDRDMTIMRAQLDAAVKAQKFTQEMIQQGFIKTNEEGDFIPVSEEERNQFKTISPRSKDKQMWVFLFSLSAFAV